MFIAFRTAAILRRGWANVLMALIVMVLIAASGSAQTDRAILSGTVLDAAGLGIPGVNVEAIVEATGLRRTTVSNERGVYTLAGLAVGRVKVTFSKAGFKGVEYSDIDLTVGQSRTVNVGLQLASVSTQVDVQAAPPPLSQSSAEISGTIQSAQVKSMPLNGRSWQGLLALTPGAINTGTGGASGVRFAGRAPDDTFIRMDSVDAGGIRGLTPVQNPRLAISLESIAEFRVNAALYSAESGGTMGGQVDIVTRAGTNGFHGAIFEYFRNDKLDSRSPFDQQGVPPFRLNQFGGNLGGRLKRDRTFFFVTYEGLRQRRGQTLFAYVPSESFRARALAASPAIAPILDIYPRSGVATADPNVSFWSAMGSQPQDENASSFRVDHRLNAKSNLFFRGNVSKLTASSPTGGSDGFTGLTQENRSDVLNGVLQVQTVFSADTLNEFRLGANRLETSGQRFNPMGWRVTIPGFTRIAEAAITNAEFGTGYTIQDNLTWIRGRHIIKTGFELRPTQLASGRTGDGNNLSYNSIGDFLANRLNSAQVAADQNLTGTGKLYLGAYIQDEWRPRSNLTFNLGMRYDYFGVFREDHGRAFPFDLQTCGGFCPAGSPFAFPDRNNFAPRVSIAWLPRALGGRTVVRTGFGLFYGEGQVSSHLQPVTNGFSRTQLSSADVPGLGYPVTHFLSQARTFGNAPSAAQRDRKDMYAIQYGLLVQHSLTGGYIAEVGYLGNVGRQLLNSTSVNLVNPATGRRPLPEFGVLGYRDNGGVSNFNSLVATIRRSMAQGWLLSANYLWSRSIDEGTVGGNNNLTQPMIAGCRRCDRATSDHDVRHNLAVNSVYELPFGPGRRYLRSRGVAGGLIGGWEASGIVTSRTGRPVNVTIARRVSDVPDQNPNSPQRPDLVPGVSLTPPEGQSLLRWINPAAFALPAVGAFGNLGRNIVTGPGQFQIDLALTKRNPITERLGFEIRAEVFNISNTPTYLPPESNLSNLSTFGRITNILNTGATGSGTPRQFQLALRLEF